MAIELQVGNEIFLYPENGSSPIEEWGEEASEWSRAVTDLLATIQSPNDITLTTFSLQDDQSVAADIVGLTFSTTQVIDVEVTYIIERIVGATVYTESGRVIGNYNGTDFFISTETVGDAGVLISVTSTGQFQYTTTNLGHNSCTIKFKASTISN